jgi:hypothetical protein
MTETQKNWLDTNGIELSDDGSSKRFKPKGSNVWGGSYYTLTEWNESGVWELDIVRTECFDGMVDPVSRTVGRFDTLKDGLRELVSLSR